MKVILYRGHRRVQNIKTEIKNFIIRKWLWASLMVHQKHILHGSKQKNLDKLKLVDYLTEQQVHQSETQITLRKIFRSENNSLTPSQAQINQLITLTKFIQKIKQPNFRIFSLASPPVAKTKSPIGPLALLTPPLILTPDL